MYSHGDTLKDMTSLAQCREWAQWNRDQPEGFTTFKLEPMQAVPGESVGPEVSTAQLAEDSAGIRQRARGGGRRASTSQSIVTTSTTSPARLPCPGPPKPSTPCGLRIR